MEKLGLEFIIRYNKASGMIATIIWTPLTEYGIQIIIPIGIFKKEVYLSLNLTIWLVY